MQDSIAKEKSGAKKCLEICAIRGGGGVGRLMAKTILNFHFDYWHTSLRLLLDWTPSHVNTCLERSCFEIKQSQPAPKVKTIFFSFVANFSGKIVQKKKQDFFFVQEECFVWICFTIENQMIHQQSVPLIISSFRNYFVNKALQKGK